MEGFCRCIIFYLDRPQHPVQHPVWVLKSKIFDQKLTVIKWNYQNLWIHQTDSSPKIGHDFSNKEVHNESYQKIVSIKMYTMNHQWCLRERPLGKNPELGLEGSEGSFQVKGALETLLRPLYPHPRGSFPGTSIVYLFDWNNDPIKFMS